MFFLIEEIKGVTNLFMVPIWSFRDVATFSFIVLNSFWYSKFFSLIRAFCLFLCWDLSSWHSTVVPKRSSVNATLYLKPYNIVLQWPVIIFVKNNESVIIKIKVKRFKLLTPTHEEKTAMDIYELSKTQYGVNNKNTFEISEARLELSSHIFFRVKKK